ncbi:unnamed protein product, partial [Arabidopsis halleri]
GIGKTTIARAVYNLISGYFQRSVFMENVKTSYTSGGSDSYSLKLRFQEKFLSQILDHKGMEITHLRTAEDKLRFLKVLVVLDGVDKLEQLNAVARRPQCFAKGTRIIVTTENRRLLEAHKIQHIYEVKFPSRVEIFCQSAFEQKFPPKGYEDLALEVTDLTSHLPLCLYVLGNALREKSVSEWTDELPRIKTSLNEDIEHVLRVGYSGLDDKDKAIFLYIACLFEGKTVDSVMKLLANSGLDIKYGLKVLVERALISIRSDEIIFMHNFLRQMGREIVRRHSICLPRRCPFLIAARDIYDVIADNTGTEIVCLASEKALSGMHHQFLRFYRNLMDKGSKLEKLWDGIKFVVFLRLSLYVISMFCLLKFGFLSIMIMSPPAFANIRFGISRRLVSAFP